MQFKKYNNSLLYGVIGDWCFDIVHFHIKDTRVPDNDLVLEWIHGYRGHDCRNAAMYTASGEVLFFAGSLIVRYG